MLPGNGDAARVELGIESVIAGIQVDTFHRGELLNIKDILTVHRSWLKPGTHLWYSSFFF